MIEVKIVVTSGRRGMGINRRGGRGMDSRMVGMVCILIWWWLYIYRHREKSTYIIFYSMIYLKKN